MSDGLHLLGDYLAKAEGGQKADHKYKERKGAPGSYQYTYEQPGGDAPALGQTASGQPIQAVERGPHSVKEWGEVLVGKTTPGHEDQAPRTLEHEGKHWIRAGYNTDTNTVGYHEYQPQRHVMDPATGFAREAMSSDVKGVSGGVFQVSGLPQKAGGDLPDEINDPHHGKLTVRGHNSDSGSTIYHKEIHNPGWNKPTGEQQKSGQPGTSPSNIPPAQPQQPGAVPPGGGQPPRPGSSPQAPLTGGGPPMAPRPGMAPPAAGQPPGGSPTPPGGPTPPQAQPGAQATPPKAPGTPPGMAPTQPPPTQRAVPPQAAAPATPTPQAKPAIPGKPGQPGQPPPTAGSGAPQPGKPPMKQKKPFGKSMGGLDALGDYLEKAHKYIKRTGGPGNYRYVYQDASGKEREVPSMGAQQKKEFKEGERVSYQGHKGTVKRTQGDLTMVEFDGSGTGAEGILTERLGPSVSWAPGKEGGKLGAQQQARHAKPSDQQIEANKQKLKSAAPGDTFTATNYEGDAQTYEKLDKHPAEFPNVSLWKVTMTSGGNKGESREITEEIAGYQMATISGDMQEKAKKPESGVDASHHFAEMKKLGVRWGLKDPMPTYPKGMTEDQRRLADEHYDALPKEFHPKDLGKKPATPQISAPWSPHGANLPSADSTRKLQHPEDSDRAKLERWKGLEVAASQTKDMSEKARLHTEASKIAPTEEHKKSHLKMARYARKLAREQTKKSMEGLDALGDFLAKAEQIPGGLAEGKGPEDFDSAAIAEGMKIEREHSDDPKIQREIALDHLSEDPNYYRKLKTIEKSERPSDVESQIEALFERSPTPDDSEVHALANKLGLDVDDLEEKIYAIAGKHMEKCGMQKGDLTPQKARQILHDGTAHGNPITDQQRKYFGAVASGSARKGMEKSMRTGLEALSEYLSKSEDPMPDNKCELGYDKSKELGGSPDGGDLDGKGASKDLDGRVGDAHGGPGGKSGTEGIGAPSPAKRVAMGSPAGSPADVGGKLDLEEEKLNEEERNPEQQMTDGKTALEEEVREKSMTPAGQRAMVAREHALKVQELTKSEDVRVGTPDHPYLMSSMGDVDQATESLLKSDFYNGPAPTLTPPGTVMRQHVLCKSEDCGCRYPAFYTACPECGGGSVVSRLLPQSGYVGAGGDTEMQKSTNYPMLRPVKVEEDLMVGEYENPVVFRTRR